MDTDCDHDQVDWDSVMEMRAEDEREHYGEHYCRACEVKVSSRPVELDGERCDFCGLRRCICVQNRHRDLDPNADEAYDPF